MIDVKKIYEVATPINGGTPSTNIANYWQGDILWVTPKDLGKLNGVYIDSTDRKISKEGLDNSSAKIIPANSVILSTRAPIGHLAINAKPMATNQGCKGLVPKENIKSKFLFYFLLTSHDLLNALGSGTTFKELSTEKLKSVNIPLPSLLEQERILLILDEVFEKIEKAKKNTEKNLQNSKELFKSYLKEIFINTRDWEHCLLNDYVKFIDYRGKTPKKTSSGIRLITAKNIKKGFLQRKPEEFISPKDYESWMTRGIPKKGDVLFTTEAPLANVAQLDSDEKVAFAQRTIIFQPNQKKLNQSFLKYLILSDPIQTKILEKGTGATVQGIKASLLKQIPISIPSLDKQEIIVSKLDNLSSQTQKLESLYTQKLSLLEELKKSVLHKAFSGEL